MSTRRRRRSGGVASILLLSAAWPGADLAGQTTFSADTGQVFNRVLINEIGTLGTWNRTGNKISRGAGGSDYNGFVADVGVSNFKIESVPFGSGGSSYGLCISWSADGQCIFTDFSNNSAGTIFKRTAGAYTAIGSWSGPTITPGTSKFGIERRGNSISVLIDGVVIATANDAFNNTATKVGFSESTISPTRSWGLTTVYS